MSPEGIRVPLWRYNIEMQTPEGSRSVMGGRGLISLGSVPRLDDKTPKS